MNLNRIVVAACTPKIHEPTYRALLAEVGLSPYYFQMINLREQCSFVHSNDLKKANAKAKRLLHAGINRARVLENVHKVATLLSHDKISQELIIAEKLSAKNFVWVVIDARSYAFMKLYESNSNIFIFLLILIAYECFRKIFNN